jgi:hypothetical protein
MVTLATSTKKLDSSFWVASSSLFLFSLSISLSPSHTITHAVLQFHSSLTKLGGSTFSIMTLGDRPLRHYLHPESYKHQLTLQRYLYRYLDLVKEFNKCFPSVECPASVDQMADSILLISVVW